MKKWLVENSCFFTVIALTLLINLIFISGLGIILTVIIVLTEHGFEHYLIEIITLSMATLLLIIKATITLYIILILGKKLKEAKS